jgi:hypothetical protein
MRGNPGAKDLASREGSCSNPVPDACMSVLVGFMVGIWVVFCVVVVPVLGSSIPIVSNLILRCAATEPPEALIHHLAPARNNSINNSGSNETTVMESLTMLYQALGLSSVSDIADETRRVETHELSLERGGRDPEPQSLGRPRQWDGQPQWGGPCEIPEDRDNREPQMGDREQWQRRVAPQKHPNQGLPQGHNRTDPSRRCSQGEGIVEKSWYRVQTPREHRWRVVPSSPRRDPFLSSWILHECRSCGCWTSGLSSWNSR